MCFTSLVQSVVEFVDKEELEQALTEQEVFQQGEGQQFDVLLVLDIRFNVKPIKINWTEELLDRFHLGSFSRLIIVSV